MNQGYEAPVLQVIAKIHNDFPENLGYLIRVTG